MTASAAAAVPATVARQPPPESIHATSGRKTSCPVAAGGEDAGDQAAPGDEPPPGHGGHEGQRHRAGAEPDEQPQQDQLPARRHEDGEPAARGDDEQGAATTRRMPKRSIRAAANGAVSPYRTRLIETAAEIVEPTSRTRPRSGSISTPGVARSPGRDEGQERDDGDPPRRGGSAAWRAAGDGAVVVMEQHARGRIRRASGPTANMCKDPAMTQAARGGVLALPESMAVELGLPHQFLGSATDADPAAYREPGDRLYGPPSRRRRGAHVGRSTVLPDHDASMLATAETVVVPGITTGDADGHLPDGVADRCSGRRRTPGWCRSAPARSCSPRPGLLDGRPATTHWRTRRCVRAVPRRSAGPGRPVRRRRRRPHLRRRGGGDRPVLHLVRRDHGTEVANRVARRNVVAPWRDGGQSQFIERPVPEPGDRGTAATRGLGARAAREPAHAGRPRRARADERPHLHPAVPRGDRAVPTRWLLQQRVSLARRLLETTDSPIERVADESGFGTAASLRQHLHAAIGVPPLTYRRTYRGPIAHPMHGSLALRGHTQR